MKGTNLKRSRILSAYPKRKLTVWNSKLFQLSFNPALRILLGTQLEAFSDNVKNNCLALFLREKGHLLLFVSLDNGKPPSYCKRILLTKVRESLDSSNSGALPGSDSPYFNTTLQYHLQTIPLKAFKDLKGVLLVLRNNNEPINEIQFSKVKPILRTITFILSLITLLLHKQQNMSRLQLINKISQRIDLMDEEDKLYEHLVQQIHNSFGYDHVAIYLIQKENRLLKLKTFAGKYSKVIPKDQVIPLNQGIVGWVATHGKTLLSNETSQNPYFVNITPTQTPTEAELCVPIRVDGVTIGVLNIEHRELLYFDKDDINSVELLADRIGIATKNARLYSEVRKSHTTLEAIASSVGYGIVMIDRDFRVQWTNRTISEWGFEMVIGNPCHRLYNNVCSDCPVSKTFQTGRISRAMLSTKSNKHYTITAIPITDSTGFVTHVLEVVDDITSHRQTQEELQSLKRGLEETQQLASIGELAANIVHEVRNPMNAITQAMGILTANLELNGEQDQLMNVLREEFARLNETLNTYHLLAYKKEERQFSQGDLKSVIDKVVSLLRTDQTIAQKIYFNIEINHDLIFQFDSNSMKQVFWNLLLNAVESIEGNGIINIRTRQTAEQTHILVEDNGRGIEENQLSKIFEPLYSTKKHGTGLGLTIVRRIIEDHDWKISASCIIPHGTCFTIMIPKKMKV
jgi:signal transduction histidine kinase/putative methionine-R-sulfoxide reductase with GAF domain